MFVIQLVELPINRLLSLSGKERVNVRAIVAEPGVHSSHCNLGQQSGNAWLELLTGLQLTESGFSCTVTLRHLLTAGYKTNSTVLLRPDKRTRIFYLLLLTYMWVSPSTMGFLFNLFICRYSPDSGRLVLVALFTHVLVSLLIMKIHNYRRHEYAQIRQ